MSVSSPAPKDQSSNSNPDKAVVTHLFWEADIDFDGKKIRAVATYDVEIVDASSSSATTLRLDTANLDIRSVEIVDGGGGDGGTGKGGGTPASYSMTTTDLSKSHLGSCLEVQLPPVSADAATKKKKLRISIAYATCPLKCSAVQWLPPSQTAGKRRPYLFTQCQAIHARSLLPCQDAPGVKMTYEARVTVPSWATCVMSALSKDADVGLASGKEKEHVRTFEFNQPVPISSYLFALAVGELASKDVSPRCKVWSEPSMVDAVAYEFAETEKFLEAAETLTGVPYQWTRYDLLILPPSFPYGGMENPCLTFVTPTLIAGDRSLAGVVANEAAHSWSGNLVTNATWQHFWLNEGWTMFLQRKIMALVRNEPKVFDFDAFGGWKHLGDSVALLPDEYTKLVPNLGDGDPDDAFSRVPYEKGFNLLYALEKMVGAEAFAGFMKAYFDRFKFGTVTTEEFRAYFESYFGGGSGGHRVSASTSEDVNKFDWETWLYKPGMPDEPKFDRSLSEESSNLAKSWLIFDERTPGSDDAVPPGVNIESWSTCQKLCFLDELSSLCTSREAGHLSIATLNRMKEAYSMHESTNSEVLFRFLMLAVEAGDETVIPIAIRFITSQGRMKFVRPLYRALFHSSAGKAIAVSTFLEHKDFYHPIAAKMVASDLKVPGNDDVAPDGNDGDTTKENLFPRKNVVLGAVLVFSAIVGIYLFRGRRR